MLDVLSIRPKAPSGSSPVILMVSGGSDSTALLVRAASGELSLPGEGAPVASCRLHALHVNHGIRGDEADGDEAFVRGLCARLGVDFRPVRADVPAEAARVGGNLEEVAREARYRAAWEWACELARTAGEGPERARIAVAHTADDRAETFLMRAMTGAGAGALAGLRAERGIVARPLLSETREGLRSYLRERGVTWREDSTNASDEALRSYVRHHVTPPMRRRCPAFAQVLGRSLDVLGEEDDLLESLAADLLARAARPAPAGLTDALAASAEPVPEASASPRALRRARRAACLDAPALAAEPLPLVRRALRQALARLLGADGARRARVEARHVSWLAGLAAAGEGTCNLPLGMRAACADGLLVIEAPLAACTGARSAADERRSAPAPCTQGPEASPLAPVRLGVPGSVAWEGVELRARLVSVPQGCPDVRAFVRGQVEELSRARGHALVQGRDVAFVDAGRAAQLAPASAATPTGADAPCAPALAVRCPHAGERVSPQGMGGHTKLVFDLLMEAGVPAASRGSWPVVCAAEPSSASGQTGPVSCGGVVWVAGIRTDARVAYHSATRVLLRLELVSRN